MHLVLDTDIGSDADDALALAVVAGSPELTLDAVITVYGDTRLRARLARRYLANTTLPRNLLVASGTEAARSGRDVWWAGHEGSLFTDLESQPTATGGVRLLTEIVAARPGKVDVLAIGPLTNIAAALDLDPKFESNVRTLVMMGCDFRGGAAAAPEHNIEMDIDAAQRVFASGLDIVVGGLDLTLRHALCAPEVAEIAGSGPLGRILADEIDVWWRYIDEDQNCPHDAVLAIWLARPDMFTSTRSQVEIDDLGRSIAHPDREGRVRILDTSNPAAITAEIVARIVSASRSADR